jgi:hypothetical protein
MACLICSTNSANPALLVRGLAILSRSVISCLSLEINGAGGKGFHSVAVLKCPAISRTTNRLAFGANVPRLGNDRPRQSLDRRQLGIFSIGYLANTTPKRVFCWLEATFRIFLISIQRPVAIRAFRFLPHNVKRSLLPMFLHRMEMFSKALDSLEVRSMLREISSGLEVA